MKELEDAEILDMLGRTITKKVNKEKDAHNEIFEYLSNSTLNSIHRVLGLSKPENQRTKEITDYCEEVKTALYLITKKYLNDDTDNRTRQE